MGMTDTYPGLHSLSFAQQRILYGNTPDQLYTVAVSVVPEKRPSVQEAEKALAQLQVSHEALRSRLVLAADGTAGIDTAAADEALDRWEIVVHPRSGRGGAAVPEETEVAALNPCRYAARCDLHTIDGRVETIVLTVSHLFADGYSTQILHHDLTALLRDGELPGPAGRRQASDYNDNPRLQEQADRNTDYWKQQLRTAPRACSYNGAVRAADEEFHVVRDVVPSERARDVLAASLRFGVSPYALWAAAASLLVGRCTGQDRHVFRSITANRQETADYQAVANLALPVHVTLEGHANETLNDRVRRVHEALSSAHARGVYDSVALLRWLDTPEVRQGAAFRPAFDINYLFHDDRMSPDGEWALGETRQRMRMVPARASADLALHIFHGSRVLVRLTAGRPLWQERPAARLVSELFGLVGRLCEDPEGRVSDLDIARFPSVGKMITGHRSGVGIDPDAMEALLRRPPMVVDGSVRFGTGPAGTTTVEATVVVDRPVDTEELLRRYTDLQRWTTGTVVPDELSVVVRSPGV